MSPIAYGLRDHDVFRTPISINTTATSDVPTPDAWKDLISTAKVSVLPLVDDVNASFPSGWCTYTYEHQQAPEFEFMCGGINSKRPHAGAIWRQGNLLHFGFSLAPDELNDTGKNLLVNCICYIARFTEDRPIIHTPSPFVEGQAWIRDRDRIARLSRELISSLPDILQPAVYDQLRDKSYEEIQEWFRVERPFICSDKDGLFYVDQRARSFGVSPAEDEFLVRAIEALSSTGEKQSTVRELLEQYVPIGPPATASATEWSSWWKENHDYLYFSDTGGYRWYVDSLAKARGIPTTKLRGTARASLPAVR